MNKPTITICTSASFYKQAVAVQDELEQAGYNVLVPETVKRMRESGDFEVSHYKTWLANADDYGKKAALMRAHFDKVAQGDAVLVLNYEKHGTQRYIGANVLMEMALAFYLQKPIFILNELPESSAFEEELKGMQPIILHGDLKTIADHS